MPAFSTAVPPRKPVRSAGMGTFDMGFALRAKRGGGSFPSPTSKARRAPSPFGALAARSPRRFRTQLGGEAPSSGYAKSTLNRVRAHLGGAVRTRSEISVRIGTADPSWVASLLVVAIRRVFLLLAPRQPTCESCGLRPLDSRASTAQIHTSIFSRVLAGDDGNEDSRAAEISARPANGASSLLSFSTRRLCAGRGRGSPLGG